MRLPILLTVGLAVAGQDPAMFRGGPQHLGHYGETALVLSKVIWTFKTAGKVIGSPTVHQGMVYVGSSDRHLYALDAKTGERRWAFKTGGAVDSTPAVTGGMVLFSSRDGLFYALEAATGALKWRFETKGERRFTAPGIHGAQPRTEMMPDPFDVFLSSPVTDARAVFFGSGDGGVYALEVGSGKLLWRFATGNVVHASPAMAGGKLFIGSWDRNFYALDAATGTRLWSFTTGEDRDLHNQEGIASSACVAGDTVFFGCRDGHFYALEVATGKERWRHDNQKGWVIASPAAKDGMVCFPTSDGTRFKVLDAKTGALKLSLANKAVSFSSPALAGRTAYYGTSDGWLHGVDLDSGREVASFQSEGCKLNGALWLDETGKMKKGLYPDITLDGLIIGLDRMFSLGSFLSSPVVVDGVLFVGSTDGRVYAIR